MQILVIIFELVAVAMATAAALSARHGIFPGAGRYGNCYDYPSHSSVGTSPNGDLNLEDEAMGHMKSYQKTHQW